MAEELLYEQPEIATNGSSGPEKPDPLGLRAKLSTKKTAPDPLGLRVKLSSVNAPVPTPASAPNNPPVQQNNGIPVPEPVDPIKNLRDLNKIATTPVPTTSTVVMPTMGGSVIETDKTAEELQKKSKIDFNTHLSEFANNNNLDVNNFKQAFADFPNADARSLTYYTDLLKKNPTRYAQQQMGDQMLRELEKTKNPEIKKYVDELNYYSTEADNLYQLNDQVQKGIATIRAAPQDDIFGYANNKREAERLFEEKKSYEYNVVNPDIKKAYYDSGYRTSMGLSPYQFAALEQIKQFHPEQYEQYIGILQNDTRSSQQSKEAKDDYEYQRGVEEVKHRLEKMGRENTERYLSYHLADNADKIQSLTDEYTKKIENAQSYEEKVALLKEYNSNPIMLNALNLENEKEDLKYRTGQDDTNFPYHKSEYADQVITDALNEAKHGLTSRFFMTLGKTGDNTARWIGNTIINLLGSGEMKMNAAAKNIGHSKSMENLFYQPKSLSGTESPFTLSNNMVGAIKNIFEDDRLDEEEKRRRAIEYIKNNQDLIKVNPKAGEHNWTVKAGLNAGLDTVSSILGLVGETALMGGGNLASASKLRGVINTFTPMFMSTQQEHYEKNLAAGVDHPYQRATAIAAIVSAAALINPPAKVIRGMFTKDPVMGKIIAGMDDAMIDNIIKANSKWVNMGKEFLKSSGRQLGLANLQYGLAAPLGEYAFNKGFMGDDISLKRMLKDAFITTNITMALPVLFHGVTGARASQISPQQKYALYEAATNAETRLLNIDDLVKKGEISPTQGEQIKTVLEDAKTELDFLNNSSIKIQEDKKAEVLFNMVRRKTLERKLKDAKTDLEKSNVESKIEDIDKEIVELKKPAPKGTQNRESLLEDGKNIIEDAIAEGKIPEAMADIVRNSPEQFFKEVAEQSLNKIAPEAGSPREATIKTYGQDIVDIAEKLFPAEKVNEVMPEPPKESGVSVILPEQMPKNETITIAPKEEPIINEEITAETGEPIPETKTATPVLEPTEQSAQPAADAETTGITHAQMNETARELGLDTYEGNPETQEKWKEEARKRIDENPTAIPELLAKMEKGSFPTAVEQKMMGYYVASLKARMRDNPTPELLKEYSKAQELSNVVGGRLTAKSLAARVGEFKVEDTIENFLADEAASRGEETLSQKEINDLKSEYEKGQADKKAYEEGYEKSIEQRVKAEVEKILKLTGKAPKKTREQFVSERKTIIQKMRADLLKVAKGGGGLQVSVPGLAQLQAIAPHVPKLIKSYIQEGIIKVEEVIARMHNDLEEVAEGITEDQIKGLIYGEYKTKRPKVKLDEQTQKFQDDYIQFLKEVAIRRDKAAYDRLGTGAKTMHVVDQVLGLKRQIQTSIDWSIPFRQGITIMANPRHWDIAGKGIYDMARATFSQKKYDRINFELKNDPRFKEMEEAGVHFTDVDTMDNTKREEDSQKSYLTQIPILKHLFLGTNRAAATFSNVARFERYAKLKGVLDKYAAEKQLTPEQRAEWNGDAAKWVNNLTGRGNMLSFLESPSGQRYMGRVLYGGRLMASRFNLLNPVYYGKMPKAVRIEALKDMGAFAGTMIATGLALKAGGADITLDPDDPDFLKAKWGDKRYDISGGLVNYIRLYSRLAKLGALRFNPNNDPKEDTKYGASTGKAVVSFFRYKLAPNTSYFVDAVMGKDALGRDFNPTEVLKLYPMYMDDLMDAWKDEGAMSLATVLAPSLLGVGVQDYEDKKKKGKGGGGAGASGNYREERAQRTEREPRVRN